MSKMIHVTSLPSAIERKLRTVRRRGVLLAVARGVAIGGSVLLVAMIAAMTIDWVWTLFDPGIRTVLTLSSLAVALVTLAIVTVMPVRHAMRRLNAARAVDAAVPQLQQRWTTVANFTHSSAVPTSVTTKSMLDQVTSEAVAMQSLVRPNQIASAASIRPALLGLAACLLAMSAFLAVQWEQTSILLQRFWSPTQDITATQLVSVTGDQLIPRGEAKITSRTPTPADDPDADSSGELLADAARSTPAVQDDQTGPVANQEENQEATRPDLSMLASTEPRPSDVPALDGFRPDDIQNPPPSSQVMQDPQQNRSGQNTETTRRRLKITERLSAIAAADSRLIEEQTQIRDRVVAIDEMLAETQTALKALVDHEIPDTQRGEQFKKLDAQIGDIEKYSADLRTETRDNEFAFVGLQMVDITRTHVTPARDRVFVAIRNPNASDVDAKIALGHVLRARELLAALLVRYD